MVTDKPQGSENESYAPLVEELSGTLAELRELDRDLQKELGQQRL